MLHEDSKRIAIALITNENDKILMGKRNDTDKWTMPAGHIEKGELPRCECGGLLRPDVVWYGEMLPQDVLSKALRVTEHSDLFLSIGTSAVVQPAASLPVIAKRNGGFVIEINKEPTVISDTVDLFLQGKSGEILPELIENVWQER